LFGDVEQAQKYDGNKDPGGEEIIDRVIRVRPDALGCAIADISKISDY
jgi:hypothetical protein